jgi:hypothetical protein
MGSKHTKASSATPADADDQAIITKAKRRTIKAKRLDVAGSGAELRALYRDLRLEVRHVPIASLRPYKRALRKHSKRHIEQLTASVAAFGLVQPILIDQHAEIIAGHGLVEAARQCGYTEVAVVRIDHLDEPQKRALRIGLNRLGELCRWDEDLLRLEFQELVEIDLRTDLNFDVAITGFDQPQIDQLVSFPATAAEDTEDEIPEVAEGPVVSRLGDQWRVGEHRIRCGDATDPQVYALLLGDEKPVMGIFDPPLARRDNREFRQGEDAIDGEERPNSMVSRRWPSLSGNAARHASPRPRARLGTKMGRG